MNDSEPTDFCVQDSIDFVENICTTSYEQIRSLCQSPISRELRKICLPSASHIDRISTTYRSDNNTSTAIDMCEENPSSEAKLKGIICAVLCDALSALSSCEEVLGDYVFARALHASLAKLQKVISRLFPISFIFLSDPFLYFILAIIWGRYNSLRYFFTKLRALFRCIRL